MLNKIISLALASSLLLLTGCGGTAAAADSNLMKDIKPSEAQDLPGVEGTGLLNGFAINLLKNAEGESRLVSPLSVISALGMCANGAKGETLAQLEEAFGLPVGTLNTLIYNLTSGFPKEEGNAVRLANSIWIKDDPGLKMEKPFLQANADYYGAAARREPFDQKTLEAINSWVNENTDGMIENILDEIPSDAVIYLINALCFDAEWDTSFWDSDVSQGEFTTEAGEKRAVDFMHSEEYQHLSGDNFQGFLKPYKDAQFAFMALLPDEGIALEDFVQGLTGEKLTETLKNEDMEPMSISMPKFEAEYSTELNAALQAMGIVDLFGDADLSAMAKYGDGNLNVSRVIHKTYISVDQRGTRAGAATAMEMRATGMWVEQRVIELDRPFVYGIIELESGTPLFLGTLADIQ